MKNPKIILLGSIPKGDNVRKNWIDWKKEYVEKIGKAIPAAKYIHGDLISDNEGAEAVVGHDLYLIKHSDIAIVHAVSKVGIGTAQEILMAKKFNKPVIVVMPKDTHHRKSNMVFNGTMIEDFINPFFIVSTDFVAENIEQAIEWIKNYLANPKTTKIKELAIMEDVIAKFEIKYPELVGKYKKQGW